MMDVEIDVCSGLPNPRWTLDAALADEILVMLAKVLAGSPSETFETFDGSRLGYRGITIISHGVRVVNGYVFCAGRVFVDSDGLESRLLSSAPEASKAICEAFLKKRRGRRGISVLNRDHWSLLMANLKKLVRAIRKHGGLTDEEIIDAANHGADSGFGGFVYVADTVRFYDANQEEIWQLLSDSASEMGESIHSLIGSFRTEYYDLDSFKNLMAWFALEEAGRWLEGENEAR